MCRKKVWLYLNQQGIDTEKTDDHVLVISQQVHGVTGIDAHPFAAPPLSCPPIPSSPGCPTILSYPFLSYPTLPDPVPSGPVLSYPIMSKPILSYVSYPICQDEQRCLLETRLAELEAELSSKTQSLGDQVC